VTSAVPSPASQPPLTTFLVERYLPAAGAQDLEDSVGRLALICADLSDGGPTVSYLQSVYLPSEDACFCIFAATSSAAVLAVNSAADFPLDRITAGVALLASSSGDAP
jgi:Protein of unknown function (DUF4242)